MLLAVSYVELERIRQGCYEARRLYNLAVKTRADAELRERGLLNELNRWQDEYHREGARILGLV